MAIILGGLLALFSALDRQTGTATLANRFGVASTTAALALYGAVLAVDGVALKQAVNAWINAPEAEKAARFASAEVVRWLEWGTRSCANVTLGLALVFAAEVVRRTTIPRPIAYVMCIAGLSYLAQGWLAGAEGFSRAHAAAIIVDELVNATWMTWLLIVAWRMPRSESSSP
jgi:hypothetical protein